MIELLKSRIKQQEQWLKTFEEYSPKESLPPKDKSIIHMWVIEFKELMVMADISETNRIDFDDLCFEENYLKNINQLIDFGNVLLPYIRKKLLEKPKEIIGDS